MDPQLGESRRVPEGRKHPLKTDQLTQVQVRLDTVLEAEAYAVAPKGPGLNNVHKHALLQRRDGL